jgi:hypothetical protein
MRSTELILILALAAAPALAQQPDPAPGVARSVAVPQNEPSPLRQSALKFLEACDARQRLEQNLDKLLDDGKQALMKRDPLLNPKFADEWVKRMRQRINLDEFVDATAAVYEKYYTREELDQMMQAQLAKKQAKAYPIPAQLAEKMKFNSAQIQTDINTATSNLGSRLSIMVGEQIEKDHPEWATPVKQRSTQPHKS